MNQPKGQWIRAARASCAVVFVHGILSSSEKCWHSGDVYWPRLLGDEQKIADVGIYVFSYRSDVFSGGYRLGDAVEALNAYLELDGLLRLRKLIFVCHSMGGIVVRQFLVTRQATLIASHTQVSLFLVASPSLGSQYANLLSGLAKVFGNSQAQVLRFADDNAWLNDLDRNFINLKESGHLSIEGQELVEDEFIIAPHFLRNQVVRPFSGAKYFGDSIKIPHSNHFTIASPKDSSALQHRLLLQLVSKFCEGCPKDGAMFPVEAPVSSDRANVSFSAVTTAGAYPSTQELTPTGSHDSWRLILPSRAKALLVIGPLILAITGLMFLRFNRTTHLITEKDSILLGDFTNTTGDTIFDEGLRQGLAAQLEQSPFITLVSEARINEILHSMGKPIDAQLTSGLALDVCQRAKSVAAITGAIAQFGTQYDLVLRAVNCGTGELLTTVTAEASDRNHVLTAVGRVASGLRKNLGESLSTLQKYDTPVELASTPSLEALKAFGLGRKEMVGQSDSAASVPFFQRAIELDPSFAMAYASLGTSYYNLGEKQLAAENTANAYQLRAKVSDRERFYIESHYYDLATGDLRRARDAYTIWNQIYPRDTVPPTNLGAIYARLGQHEAYNKGLEFSPGSGLNLRQHLCNLC